eukprot:scaffold111052_cov14-Tisochrysis_lutea.AAC.1
MQAGFALYAAGVVRAKNIAMSVDTHVRSPAHNARPSFQVLLKNFMDACIAALSFWLVGYAFAFGAKDNTNGELFQQSPSVSWHAISCMHVLVGMLSVSNS